MPQQILIEHRRAAGDVLVLTGAVRDLVTANPGKFEVYVNTSCNSLWENNPHIAGFKFAPVDGQKRLLATYGHYIRKCNQERLHFSQSFHRNLSDQLEVPCPVLKQYGDVHLSDWHKENPPITGRYWYVIAGGKSDFPTKIWSTLYWQQSVDILRQYGVQFVQDGALHTGHMQPPLQNVLNTINRTNVRDMLWLIYHADGVICHVTAAMHMAAALNKPCVVIAGGREHWWWEAYCNVAIEEQFGPECEPIKVPHRYLHTQTLLDCCSDRGCWKNKVINDGSDSNNSYCKRPVKDDYGQDLPECLLMIKPEHVAEAVMSYYEDGTLPPIGKPKKIALPTGKNIVAGTLSNKTPHKKGFIDLFASPSTFAQTDKVDELEQVQEFEKEKTGDAQQNLVHNDIFDNPIIGGRVTICVLLYGDYYDLHRSCINAILSSVPAARMELRVAANEPCLDTKEYLRRLHAEGKIFKVYINEENIKKYPAMRKMFQDKENPIKDNYVMWFDDDTIADRDAQWFVKLCATINTNHENNYRYYGPRMIWNFSQPQIEWIKSRPWYRHRNFQMKNGLESPNASKVIFAPGGFFAAEMAAIRRADVPDVDIGHNGGDYMVGAQLWQNNCDLKDWNRNKTFVHTSSVPRRGLSEIHTGQKDWKPGGVCG